VSNGGDVTGTLVEDVEEQGRVRAGWGEGGEVEGLLRPIGAGVCR